MLSDMWLSGPSLPPLLGLPKKQPACADILVRASHGLSLLDLIANPWHRYCFFLILQMRT